MKNVFAFTRRHITLFLRDRSAVFFSFLSTLILVGLYFLFIAKMYTTGILEEINTLTVKDAHFLVYLQMMAGVLVLNSVSLSMGSFVTIAKDFETRRTDVFLSAPARKWQLLLSYVCSAFVVSFALNLITWGGSAALIGALTGHFVQWPAFLTGVGILAAASAISCALMFFVTTVVRSSAAIGVLGGIMGTFLGFLCGIYMPYSQLGSGTQAVGSLLPFTHITIWLKQTVLHDAFGQLNLAEPLRAALLKDVFSAGNAGLGGADVPLWGTLVLSAVFGVLCLAAAWMVLGRRVRQSR